MTTTEWISSHAHPVTTFDPQAPLTDLLPLHDIVGDATVVALGSSSRQARELAVLSHRILRFLVEHKGFRSLVLEGDDVTSALLDEFVRTGTGDPRALLANARSFWRIEEILDAVLWARSYNEKHSDDPVRIAHPQQIPAQLGSLAAIERLLADNTIAWHELTGHKIVYWGGLAHTANGNARSISPSTPTETGRNAGSYLREHYGSDYVSIGLTFDHGSIPYTVPVPAVEFAETVLSSVELDSYFLGLQGGKPDPAQAWVDAPTKTRLIGPHYDIADDAAYHLAGGSLGDWFDAVVHVREVSSVRFLSSE